MHLPLCMLTWILWTELFVSKISIQSSVYLSWFWLYLFILSFIHPSIGEYVECAGYDKGCEVASDPEVPQHGETSLIHLKTWVSHDRFNIIVWIKIICLTNKSGYVICKDTYQYDICVEG